MEERDWIIESNDELKNMAEVSEDQPEFWKKRSIYRIPAHAANLNKEAYKPWALSLGPYHHGDEHLKPMEVHKHRALRHFLHRSQKPIERYVDALAEVVQDLMDTYDQLDVAWIQNAKGFLQFMIVDGCFILEIMRAYSQTMNDYPPNDPIFSDHGKLYAIPSLRRDMLLVENQVPLLVLDRLLAVEGGNIEQNSNQVIQLILKFCGTKGTVRRMDKCQHILDVYRKSLIFDVPKLRSSYIKSPRIDKGTVHSATDMKQAGIKFGKSNSASLKDISFRGRTLSLPAISLDDISESIFLNIIAFERFHVGAGNEVTSYIFFMNRLTSSVKDARLLKSHGIISNAMGCDEDVAKLFLILSKEIIADPNSWLDEVYLKVSAKLGSHFKKTLNEWRFNLIHTYFRSPWAIVSVIAAAFGFGLSITQTIYAILSYIH